MKPSWVLSADERERRFRKSKAAKKLKTEDEECNDMVTTAVVSNPAEENVLFMIPSTAVSTAAVLQNVKLESVMETDGATALPVVRPSSSGKKDDEC